MCKLINRIPGSRLLKSSLPGSASRTHIESLSKPRDLTNVLEALTGEFDIKRHSPSNLYIYGSHFILALLLVNENNADKNTPKKIKKPRE